MNSYTASLFSSYQWLRDRPHHRPYHRPCRKSQEHPRPPTAEGVRYEIEVMEDRGRLDPVMVDFVMVSAIDGQVVERLSEALGKKIQ